MIGFSEIHNLTEKLESKKLFAVELWKFFIEWTRIELFWSVFFVDMQKVNFIKYIPLFLTLKVTALCARQCVYLVVPNLAASTKQRLCHSARQPQQPLQWGRWVLVDLTRKRTRRGDADGGTARRPARCAGSSCVVRGGSCAHLAPRAWRRLAVVLEATAETRTRRFTSYVATIKHSRTAAASALHCTVQSSQLLSSYCCTAAWLRPDSYSGVLCSGVILVMEFGFMVQNHSKSPRFKYHISSYKALPWIIVRC